MLILVDGSNLSHRAIHASFNDLGYYSALEAVPYFLKRLVSILNYQGLTAGVIVAWDKGLPIHRRELYSEYKPDSSPIGISDPRLLSKINLDPSLDPHRVIKNKKDMLGSYHKLVDILSSVILPCFKCISSRVLNVEADDIIAFVCDKLPDQEKQIVSSDRDLLQLIDPSTSVYNFMSPNKNGNVYDYDWVTENYTDPDYFRISFLIEKAITGDTSDNIRGVEAVGEITAKKYTEIIINNLKTGLSLEESISKVQKPPRASSNGFNNLIEGFEIVKRNLGLMDLFSPIYQNLDMVYNIQKNLVSYLNFNLSYDQAVEKLESIEGLQLNKCYSLVDKIYESNSCYEMTKTLEVLRDASSRTQKPLFL